MRNHKAANPLPLQMKCMSCSTKLPISVSLPASPLPFSNFLLSLK